MMHNSKESKAEESQGAQKQNDETDALPEGAPGAEIEEAGVDHRQNLCHEDRSLPTNTNTSSR